MINYSNPLLNSIRGVAQKMGVLRPLVRTVRKLFNSSYEDEFDKEMMRLISPGDVVWDIGANIGYFTKKFSEKVGENGSVYAFEPAANTFATLATNCSALGNVICMNIALSNNSGKLSFRDSGIENDPTNGLVADGTVGAVVVEVATGDELLKSHNIQVPNVLKIDVEGFEVDVIQGMRAMLRNSRLKMVFIEVHFLEMRKRGLKNGAMDLVNVIVDSGFNVTWTDPSHFIAARMQ